MSYGDIQYGEPVDYFQQARFNMINRQLKVSFDLENRKFLPDLQKIQDSVQSNACDTYCDIKPTIDYEQIKDKLSGDSSSSYFYRALEEFEYNFNKNYMKEIRIFLQSPMVIYKISRYCVKLIKGIRLGYFEGSKSNSYYNRVTKGHLDDLYGAGELNPGTMGIMFGYRTKNIEAMIKIDRQCMINKIFGRAMDE